MKDRIKRKAHDKHNEYKNVAYSDENSMTYNMDDVEALGEEMEEVSQNNKSPIDNTNYGADYEDEDLDNYHKKTQK